MSSNKNYHLKDTWQERYRATNCQNYQWISSGADLYQKIAEYLPEDKDIHILQLGCGSSLFCDTLIENGYSKITCIDFSKRIIKSRSTKNSSQIQFICSDFTEPFTFEPETKYDLIIDKGSIDCIFCDEDYLRKVLACLMNCHKRLNINGKLISVSMGQEKNRVYWYRNKLIPFQLQVKRCTNGYKQQLRKNGRVNDKVRQYNKSKQQGNQEYIIIICRKVRQVGENINKQCDVNDEEQNNMGQINMSRQQDGQQQLLYQKDNNKKNNQQQQNNKQQKINNEQQQNNSSDQQQQQQGQQQGQKQGQKQQQNNSYQQREQNQDNYQNQFQQTQ